MTFDEMGVALGVSRARAMQLVHQALARFVRQWNRAYPGDPLPPPVRGAYLRVQERAKNEEEE